MELLLRKGELFNLGRNAKNSWIQCKAGVCWLTCAGMPGDHLLTAGQSLKIENRGRLVLTVLRGSQIRIRSAARPKIGFQLDLNRRICAFDK